MIYVVAGVAASLLMLLHHLPVAATSPLRSLTQESAALGRRLQVGGVRFSSWLGLVLSFSILFLISALRYGIGTDYQYRHVPAFARMNQGIYGEYRAEPIFVWLNRAVGWFTDDAQWLIVLMAFLTLLLIYRFILRMSLNPALSVFLFVFGGSYLEAFNLMQQGLAIAIVLNTIELALRRKRLAFVLLTFVAVGVHSSAIAWFFVWPILRFRGNRLLRLILMATIAGVIAAAPGALYWAVNQVAPDYAWYFQSNYGTIRSIEPSVVATTVALFLLSALLVRTGSGDDRYASGVVNLMGLNVAILGATLFVAYLFFRLNSYFTPVQIVVVPLLISSVRSTVMRRTLTLGFMLAYVISFYLQFIKWNAHGVLPYESIFSR
jgi:hypothetical protein